MPEMPKSLPETPFLCACIAKADESSVLPVLETLRSRGVRVFHEKEPAQALMQHSEASLCFLTENAVKDPVFRNQFTQSLEKRTLAAIIRQPVLPPVMEAQLFRCRYQFLNTLSAEQILKWLKKLPEAAACLQGELLPEKKEAEAETAGELELCCLRTGQRMRLRRGSDVLIGRKAGECQFVVADSASVSRKHAILRSTNAGWTLEDLHTTNGTRVNGVYLETGTAARLKAGDRFSLGKESFVLQNADTAGSAG